MDAAPTTPTEAGVAASVKEATVTEARPTAAMVSTPTATAAKPAAVKATEASPAKAAAAKRRGVVDAEGQANCRGRRKPHESGPYWLNRLHGHQRSSYVTAGLHWRRLARMKSAWYLAGRMA